MSSRGQNEKRLPLSTTVFTVIERFRKRTGNVASIAFGRTFCSVAYRTVTDREIAILRLNVYHVIVPTTILLKETEDIDRHFQYIYKDDPVETSSTYKVDSFGYEAQARYHKLKPADHPKFLYFELNLHNDENVNSSMVIKASNGREFYLVGVIAFILKYLRKELEYHFHLNEYELTADDFDWVITIPVKWSSRGKYIMREAAYRAGLCSPSQESSNCLIEIGHGIPHPHQFHPDKLTIVLNAEAVPMYCQTMRPQDVPEYCQVDGSLKSNCYLVVDTGEDAIDITSHKYNEITVEPTGNDCGDVNVNKEFLRLLQKIVKDTSNDANSGFCRFLATKDPGTLATRRAEINTILRKDFEVQKLTFASLACGLDPLPREYETLEYEEILVDLPYQFVSFYGLEEIHKGVAALQDPRIELEDSTLYIKYPLVCELFQPAVDGILCCIASVLDRRKGDIDAIYLVGDFGSSKYVYQKIVSLCKAKFSEYNIRVIVPNDSLLAAAKGAVKYLDPDIIHQKELQVICQQQLKSYSQLQYEFLQESHQQQQEGLSQLQEGYQQQREFCFQKTHQQEIIELQQNEYSQLREIYQQQQKELSQLQENHQKQQEELFQLQEDYQQQQEELSQLQEDHQQQQEELFQLQEDYQQQQEELFQLQEDHQQQQEELSQLQEDHQKQQEELSQLQEDYQQQQEELSQLQEDYQQQQEESSHIHKALQQEIEQQRNEYSKLQEIYEQQEKDLSQLQEDHQQQLLDYQQQNVILEQIQKELETKQEEMEVLQRKITSIKNSWKVSHKDIIITKEELGRGGWGVIWVGIFREQRVAVKQMYQIIMNPDNLKLLHREINTMAQLRHPNLLQFIGAVLDDPSGNPMIITEIMDTSLRNAYETKQLTPDPTCEYVLLTIIRDVAVGLNYLHCLPDPIIHRDVSSANVLLESKGRHKWKTKISDFGSANKACQAVTRGTGAFIYSAPESIPNLIDVQKALTTKMDIYSYGVLLCEIMTCRFPDSSVFQEMLQHVRSRAPPLYELIISCIKKDPDNRPTIKQVIELLDKYST